MFFVVLLDISLASLAHAVFRITSDPLRRLHPRQAVNKVQRHYQLDMVIVYIQYEPLDFNEPRYVVGFLRLECIPQIYQVVVAVGDTVFRRSVPWHCGIVYPGRIEAGFHLCDFPLGFGYQLAKIVQSV